MLIQTVQARAAESVAMAPRSTETGSSAAQAGSSQADQVVVSEQARALSAQLAAHEGPELQLSPERLRALMQQAAAAASK